MPGFVSARVAYMAAALLFLVLGASVALFDAPIAARFVAALPDAIGAILGGAACVTLGARRRVHSGV